MFLLIIAKVHSVPNMKFYFSDVSNTYFFLINYLKQRNVISHLRCTDDENYRIPQFL